MKKLFVLLILSLFFTGCSTSPYVGTWEAYDDSGKFKYNLILDEDGNAVSQWADGTVRTGEWEETDDGIAIDGKNVNVKAKISQGRLIATTINNTKIQLIRKQIRHKHKH